MLINKNVIKRSLKMSVSIVLLGIACCILIIVTRDMHTFGLLQSFINMLEISLFFSVVIMMFPSKALGLPLFKSIFMVWPATIFGWILGSIFLFIIIFIICLLLSLLIEMLKHANKTIRQSRH